VDQILLFSLLGLGTGSLIAGVAVSLVVTYRGTGVINLAAGAVSMLTAFSFWSLTGGTYGPEIGNVPAFAITLLVAIGAGLVMEFAAFRPLRTATPLAKLVATLGLLLIAQAGMLLAFGAEPKTEPSILPHGAVAIFNVQVPIDRFVLTGIVLAITVVLSALYRWSRFGLCSRAASENEVSAMLVGLSPNRLSMASTLIACVVSGTLGVLAAPLISLDTDTLPLIVVPALAAALLARFTSVGIACACGLAIGIAENLLYYASTQSFFPTDHGNALPGVTQVLVLVAIVIGVFWRGASLPGRGEIIEKRLPLAPRPERLLAPAVIAAVVGSVALVVLPFDFRQALMNSLIGTVLVLSLVIITGFVGQVSVMQLALSGVSGFTISHLATDAGIGFPVGLIIGAVGATVLGMVMAVCALRVRGVTLAVVTLAAAVTIEEFGFNNSTWGGGASGAPVPQPHLLGINLGNNAVFRGLDDKLPSPVLGFVVLAIAIALCLLVCTVRRGILGQRMLAVRANERAAAAVGISVRNTKLTAFALGSLIAGVAGGLSAYNFGSISADRFSALTALSLIAFAYIGGITMVSGALFAGALATEGISQHAFEKWFGISGTWTLLFAGVALIMNVVMYPEGVAGATFMKRQAKKARRAAEAAAPARIALSPLTPATTPSEPSTTGSER
jgi:branched-subunit amino acid ABC-type transport system permease component